MAEMHGLKWIHVWDGPEKGWVTYHFTLDNQPISGITVTMHPTNDPPKATWSDAEILEEIKK